MNRDTPAISTSNYTGSTYGAGDLAAGAGIFTGVRQGGIGQFHATAPTQSLKSLNQIIPEKPKEKPMSRRLVQVFIADPEENVPLADSLLYSGTQKLTDATDQELFFEIDIKAVLEKHNTKRVTFINKKVKERTEYLEPVKIRDLKMVVVNVATFS